MSTATVLPTLRFSVERTIRPRYGIGRRYNEGSLPSPSTKTLARGGKRMGEQFKRKNIGLVKVVTDDAVIDLGMLLRNDEKRQIRLCCCTDGRRGLFEIVAVDRGRIKEFVELN